MLSILVSVALKKSMLPEYFTLIVYAKTETKQNRSSHQNYCLFSTLYTRLGGGVHKKSPRVPAGQHPTAPRGPHNSLSYIGLIFVWLFQLWHGAWERKCNNKLKDK